MLLKLAPTLSLPLEIVTCRTSVYGTSGAGKTAFGRLFAERVHDAGQRFVAIDLKNDWWGLKSTADGRSEGLPVVIFGGPRGDLDLLPESGAVVADTVAEIDQSVVLDLDAMSKGKQLRFLAAFLERLYDVNRRPLLLFADEADRYAAQKPMSPEAIVALGASEDIARRARKRGIGSFWVTQRTAVLNKNVADLCDLTVVFRTPGARDLDELEDRVGRLASKEQVRDVMRAAPALENGEAIFLSTHPELRKALPETIRPIQLPLPRTFDSSATPGVRKTGRVEAKVLAQADLAAIRARMAETIERSKADDPKELRKQIAELRQQLAKRSEAPVKMVDKPVLTDSAIRRVEAQIERFDQVATRAGDLLAQSLAPLRESIAGMAAAFRTVRATALPLTLPAARSLSSRQPPAPAQPARAAGDGKAISGPQQQILNALAWLRNVGIPAPKRQQVALVARVSHTSSGFEKNLSTLRTAGLIDYPGHNLLALTVAGDPLAVAPQVSQDEMHAAILQRLSGPQAALLRVLLEAYPAPVGRASAAEWCRPPVSPTSSGFEKNCSTLRTLGLIEYPTQGELRAAPVLFLDGR